MIEFNQPALITQHCAISGDLPTQVRYAKVGDPKPYAQYAVSVTVFFIEPRKRRGAFFQIHPTNLRYLTIQIGGIVVYDSRDDVPCDMAEWQKTRERFKGREMFKSVRV